MSRVCSCKRGYRSAYDGKCGHCRTTREQKTHQFKLSKGLYPKRPDIDALRQDPQWMELT